jgi:hypothetical protein
MDNRKYLFMKRNEKHTTNEYTACKSLPNILFSTKSNKRSHLHRSQSLPSSLKFVPEQSQYDKRISVSNKINLIKKKTSTPTIGELLGDDDLFHYYYHHQYSSSKFQRKRHHHQSYSHSSHIHVHYGRRKQRRTNYFNTTKDFQSSSKTSESINDTNQIYFYPTTYNYTPLPTYCYYCYSNLASYCSCLRSDCYGGFSQPEI